MFDETIFTTRLSAFFKFYVAGIDDNDEPAILKVPSVCLLKAEREETDLLSKSYQYTTVLQYTHGVKDT